METLRSRRRDLLAQKNNMDLQVKRMTNEEQQRQERVKKVDVVVARLGVKGRTRTTR